MRRFVLIAIPFTWLVVLFLVPFLMAFKISLTQTATAIPPYTPTFDAASGWQGLKDYLGQLSFDNYEFLTTDDLYWKAYLSSLWIAARSTAITLLVGFPIAYGMARAPRHIQPTLVLLVILPFWTSFLIRIYAWMGLLANEGLINHFLMWTGLISEPIVMLNTPFAVYLGITYAYLPLMVLPLYSTLERLDASLIEAAQDLGCSRVKAFWLVTVPLARHGIVAGCFLVFIPAIGEFVIATLLGGSSTLMIGKVLFEEFFANRDWPVAASVAVLLLLILIVPIMAFQRVQTRLQEQEARA
ncbi:ABC transporter permease subunit [Neotabrizicola shimadae]|uniref:ABC transporter permease subunit n=1 Tax=Neotabrizicola shimadae TaxID=2807096 RepID=A0A8G1EDZ7_9RHOB|nr:ABC transporter permease subunit [Neotabrizicola shimadae]QYZ72027.1 ABC transporter permease subunit [Neotabrizicola shimadae]